MFVLVAFFGAQCVLGTGFSPSVTFRRVSGFAHLIKEYPRAVLAAEDLLYMGGILCFRFMKKIPDVTVQDFFVKM